MTNEVEHNVYVLRSSFASDCQCCDSVSVYSSEECAIEAMKREVNEDIANNIIKDDWVLDDGNC